ncbi:hypothetical protein AOQ84DRAFT_371295 [Glonium stellatum]|uniref:Nephrocystin 3-like N-terminal domain-containing protein n=1 Tax=Glonium stellatum TaxID=574774 RepID=A0A8E2FCF0_9PEZI|nr:hypothetical protein AOQ84DRAFT_371295 [Glonium stellatum]
MDGESGFKLLIENGNKAKNLQQQTLDTALSTFPEAAGLRRTNDLSEIRRYLEDAALETQEKFEKFRSQKYRGTCQWLFDKPEFRVWLAEERGMLWVYGAPGCGKSVLAAACIEKFQCENSESTPFFFFCDQGMLKSLEWEFILKAWAIQTLWKSLSEQHL